MEKKVMSDYTCYCTHSQTKKAFELGAPINKTHANPSIWFVDRYPKRFWVSIDDSKIDVGYVLAIPTAEQMIGWLEEKGFVFCTYKPMYKWVVDISRDDFCLMIEECNSKKEATLAAIDAALEYIEKQKEID